VRVVINLLRIADLQVGTFDLFVEAEGRLESLLVSPGEPVGILWMWTPSRRALPMACREEASSGIVVWAIGNQRYWLCFSELFFSFCCS